MCRPAPWSTRSSVCARDAFPDIDVPGAPREYAFTSPQEKPFNY